MRYNKQTGFTIIELLIAVIVVAILAALSFFMYDGIQKRAKDTATISAIKQYAKAINAYHAGGNPRVLPAGANGYCLGTVADYPDVGSCWVAGNEDAAGRPEFESMMKTQISPLPSFDKHCFDVGPVCIRNALYISQLDDNAKSTLAATGNPNNVGVFLIDGKPHNAMIIYFVHNPNCGMKVLKINSNYFTDLSRTNENKYSRAESGGYACMLEMPD